MVGAKAAGDGQLQEPGSFHFNQMVSLSQEKFSPTSSYPETTLGCSSKLSMKAAFAYHGPGGGGGAVAQQKGEAAVGERRPRANIALLLHL